MSDLRIPCRVNSKHTLGIVSPANDYGRLYLYCRKCKAWTPTAPPEHDPDLQELRCGRDNRQAFGRLITEWYGDRSATSGDAFTRAAATLANRTPNVTPGGCLLGKAKLNDGALLVIKCQRHAKDGDIMAVEGEDGDMARVAFPQRERSLLDEVRGR
jgi:hypothetical protein